MCFSIFYQAQGSVVRRAAFPTCSPVSGIFILEVAQDRTEFEVFLWQPSWVVQCLLRVVLQGLILEFFNDNEDF